jgi:plastocyanin
LDILNPDKKGKYIMKRLLHFGLLLTLVFSLVGLASPAFASGSQNYTVLVGSDNPASGISIMSYFPKTIQIHIGDSVTWKANSHEIHTVTFLADMPYPDLLIDAPTNNYGAQLQINPQAAFTIAPVNGMYDGSTYANSGIMTTDPGGVTTYTLTFTAKGVFKYICLVHGEMMSGTVMVVGENTAVPSPSQVLAQGQAELKTAWLTVPTVFAKAKAQITPPKKNADGTFTDTILLGYESDNIMIMKFFPGNDTVHPGDTVVWKLSSTDTAPHTVSFLNGNPDQSFVIFYADQTGPHLLLNPAVTNPSPSVSAKEPLNGTDFFNSGLIMPGGQESFSLKVGNGFAGTLNYQCLLHDTSGMVASLFVTPH